MPIIWKMPIYQLSITFAINSPPKSGFTMVSLWKEWTSFTMQDVWRVLLRNFVHCFQRQFYNRLQGGRSCGGARGPLPKSWDSDENFKPKHLLFFHELRFTHFLEIFGQKKWHFGSKAVFFGQEVHYYLIYIAYFTEFNLQICDYAQKRRICRKNCKYAIDENFHGHFCPWRKAAKFCHPDHD